MPQINPYINFNGQAREAMNFYKDCLGGELFVMAVGDSPVAAQLPPDQTDSVMHASLNGDGFTILGSDMMGDKTPSSSRITLSLHCGSKEEVDRHYACLSAGGEASHPITLEFWGSYFGTLTDKFGIFWMLNFDPNQG